MVKSPLSPKYIDKDIGLMRRPMRLIATTNDA